MRFRMPLLAAMVFGVLAPVFAGSPATFIRRLDGSRISVREAEAVAKKTLEDAHVKGAQLAVVERGKLVWSAAYGVRSEQPRELPMDPPIFWSWSVNRSGGS